MDKNDVYRKVREFHTEFDKYSISGVCDSEGRDEVAAWVHKRVANEPVGRITFRSLSGYDCYSPAYARERELRRNPAAVLDVYPNKRQIAGAVSKAANSLAKFLSRACRAGVIKPSDVYHLIR